MSRRILYNLIPVLAALGVVAIIGARFMSARTMWTKQQLRQVLRGELAIWTQRQVRVGAIEGGLLRGITVHDVAIAKPGGFKVGEAVAADEIRLRYNLVKLARGKIGPLGSIREATIVRPTVSATRGRDGKIDVVELFAPRRPRPPMVGRLRVPVVVRDGKLAYADLAIPTRSGRPVRLRAQDVNGTVDVSKRGRIRVTMSGAGVGGPAKRMMADVEYVARPATFAVHAQLEDAAILSLLDLARESPPVAVHGGRANVRGVVSGERRGGKWRTAYNVGGDISNAPVTLSQAPQERVMVSGRVRVTPRSLMISHAEAKAPSGRATAFGVVVDLLRKPYLDLQVKADGVDVGAVLAHVKLPEATPSFAVHGDAAADVAVSGAWPHVRVNGTVRLPGGHVTEERVGFGGFRAGPVSARVDVDNRARPRVIVDADIANPSMDTGTGAVWQAAPLELGDVAAATAHATVTWSERAGLTLAGTFDGLTAPAASLANGRATLRARGKRVSFDTSADLLGGVAQVEGRYEPAGRVARTKHGAAGTLRIGGRLEDLDAVAVAKLPWRMPPEAQPEEPAAAGQSTQRTAAIAEVAPDLPAEAERAEKREKHSLAAALAKVQGGRVTADFAVTYDGAGIDSQVVARTSAGKYADELVPDAEVATTLTARPVGSREKRAWVLAEGQASLHAVDERGDAWLAAELSPAPKRSDEREYWSAVRSSFAATGVDVPAIAALLGGEDLSGGARGAGWARGTWEQRADHWTLEDGSVAVSVDAAEYKKHTLNLLELELDGNLDQLAVRRCHGVRETSEIAIAGRLREVDLKKRDAKLELRATTRDSSVTDWLAVANVKRDLKGTVALAEADITGTWKLPQASGRVQFADSVAFDQSIESAEADFEYADDALRFSDVRARSLAARLSGELAIAGLRETPLLTGVFDATGVDAARVSGIADADAPVRAVLGGRGSLRVAFADRKKPDVRVMATVTGEDVALAEHPIWDLAGEVMYTNNELVVQAARCRAFGGTVRASGKYELQTRLLDFAGTLNDARTWLLAETAARLSGAPEKEANALRAVGRRFHAHASGDVSVRGVPELVDGESEFKFSRATLDKLHVPDSELKGDFAYARGENQRVFRASVEEWEAREGDMLLAASGDVEVRAVTESVPPEQQPVETVWLASWPFGAAFADEEAAPPAEPREVITAMADVRGRARNVDLRWLSRWLPFEERLQGLMDFDAALQGPLSAPRIAVSDLRVEQPAMPQVELERVSVRGFELEPGRAEVQGLLLEVAAQKVNFDGRVPFTWERQPRPGDVGLPFSRWHWLAEHLQADEPVLLEAELRRADPHVLLPLIDGVVSAAERLKAQRRKKAEAAPPGAETAEPAPALQLAERLELGGEIDGSVVIGGTCAQPAVTQGEFRLYDVRIGLADRRPLAQDVRGELVYEAEGDGKPSRIALTDLSADVRGLRVIPSGYVETAHLLTDGIRMVPQHISLQLLGRSVIVGDPWAGARVLATLPRRWLYRRDTGEMGKKEQWYSAELDEGAWEGTPPGDGRPTVGEGEVIWYRTRFKAPRSAADQLLAVSFESVIPRTELYVNGRHVGRYVPRGLLSGFEGPVGAPEPPTSAPRADRSQREPAAQEAPLARRWSVEVTDYIVAGEENVVALRVTARKGPLPVPGTARLGEVRGLVLRNIAGVITADRKALGDPLMVQVGGLPSEGIDERHVSADIGLGKLRLWGGIEVATDTSHLASLAENKCDLSLAVDGVTPRYPPYVLGGRVSSDGVIRLRTPSTGGPAELRGRLRHENGQVSLPVRRSAGELHPLTSFSLRYPQPTFNLAVDVGRNVRFVTPPLYLTSAGGGGIPLSINTPLPLREMRDALVLSGTPHEPKLRLDTEVARNVRIAPPGGGDITIRETTVGYELAPAPGVQAQREGLPLATRVLAYIEGVRNINGGSFDFVLVSPDYLRTHPEALSEYADVFEPLEGIAARRVEEEAQNWILACRPAQIADRGTRELLFLAFWPFGRVLQEGGPGVGEVALQWATERAVGRLEAQILQPIEQLLVESGLVDRVTIEGVVAGVPSFQVGKDIVDNLYVTYQRQLTTRQEEGLLPPFRFTASYRVRDRYDIGFTTDERREQRVTVDYRQPF